MPFVQMENISHFLRACQMPPLGLPDHDVFQTVDLYESKDPAQVLQCIAAFSRRANAVQPSNFPRAIGAQNKGGYVSPHLTGSSQGAATPAKSRGVSGVSGVSAVSSGSGHSSPGKSAAPVSSWSKKSDQHATMPAWNIHQYGYMGGATQANQGVMFGAPRQITTAAPVVPSLVEKEKRRREEDESLRLQKLEEEKMRQQQREAEEEHARAEEERRCEEEIARLREKERREMEEERKRWDEEQRGWEEEERRRRQEEREVEEHLEKERHRRRDASDVHLNGQFLSQYQAAQATSPLSPRSPREVVGESTESQRIKELERELEQAKERERQYENERQQAREKETGVSPQPQTRPRPVPPKPSYDLSSLEQERRMLRTEWQKNQDPPIPESPSPSLPSRPLPEPTEQKPTEAPTSPRPLPDPAAYSSQTKENRVDRFLSSNRPPVGPKPATHRPQDYSTTAEVDAENNRRFASQEKTRAGGWASKSLLEREMERERDRQREWEESQQQTQEAAAKGRKDSTLGSGPGQSWDVHQYGYMGGDNQNRVGPGLGIGGARRQIIGPRPPP